MNAGNAKLLDTFPWETTALGRRDGWSPDMLAVVRMALASGFPVCTAWGDENVQIYNDAYNPIYGHKHPGSFGAPARESWPEIWEFLGAAFEQVKATRQALRFDDTLLALARHDEPEECYFDFSYSPVVDGQGRVLGVVSIAAEKTTEVIFRRRQSITELDPAVIDDVGFDAMMRRLRDVLVVNDMDCAMAVAYSVDSYKGAPGGEFWTFNADPGFARAARPVVAKAARGGGIRTVVLDVADGPPHRSGGGCVIPLEGRGAELQGVLLLVPHVLVPVERSLVAYANAISTRFRAVSHASRARQERIGRVREEKAEQETLYRFLFENIRDGAVYCSTHGAPGDDEVVLAANDSACTMLGYTPEEVVGMSRDAFVMPGDETITRALDERSRDRTFVGDLVFRHRDGHPVPVEVTSNLVPLHNGEIRSLTIIRDIGHRAAIERERAERVRLETVASLTGGIAHDFNNLLTVIIGSVEGLIDELPHGTCTHKMARRTMLAAERAGELTSQLLSYSRRQTLVTRSVDLNAFLHEIEGLIRSSLGETNTLRFDLDGRCPPCTADPAQLTTAILNLVVNARDAMPSGGTLILRTFCTDAASLPAAEDGYGLPAGHYVGLGVEDTGVGIDPDVRSRVFEPFFTTKEIGSGSGLGLSMVQGFVRQLGGDVRVTTRPGEGTRFDLLFRAQVAPEARCLSGNVRPRASGEMVLLVEDNRLVREQTDFLLRSLGFRTVTARDGREALSRMDEGGRFDIVLTDLVMPGGISGLQLAEELRRRDPALPIVIMTGHDPRAALADDRRRPFEVLRKPYTRKTLAEVLLRRIATTTPAGHLAGCDG